MITHDQRKIALDEILRCYGDPQRLNNILPGLSPAVVLDSLATSIGENFDGALTTVLVYKVGESTTAQGELVDEYNAESANIAAWTVT